jgi:hypothetical protein
MVYSAAASAIVIRGVQVQHSSCSPLYQLKQSLGSQLQGLLVSTGVFSTSFHTRFAVLTAYANGLLIAQ